MNIPEEKLNPKCNACKTYWKPDETDIKPSGACAKTCKKCRNRQKEYRLTYKCEHGKQPSQCKACGGGSFCEHGIYKADCIVCGGSSICEHNKRRRICKECCGNCLCEHSRLRSQCKECNGGSICEHKKVRSDCKECGGGRTCKHHRIKRICKDCKGNHICEHQRQKHRCKDCNFKYYLIDLQRKSVGRLFHQSTFNKNKHSIEYLGMDSDAFILFFEKKMNLYNEKNNIKMTWNNIHIDHIKPVSVFDLDDENEFLNCCNYTNLQPLLAKDNLEKYNKWEITSELYWNTHIKDNDNFFDIYNVK